MRVANGFIMAALGVAMSFVMTNGQADLPTVYEYFSNTTTLTGLRGANNRFYLNDKEIRIVAGSFQYFRTHPDLWRNRMRKLRAFGANALETYVVWHLHEPRAGEFDFGEEGQTNDFSIFTDLVKFLKMAQEEDLLVILRPGPFICAEVDFGGMPSWLQHDPDMKVRENNKPFLDRVKIYFDQLLPRMRDLQFTRGGPIVAFQIENEYANFDHRHKEYLQFLKDQYDAHGLNESLYFTTDNTLGESGFDGSLPGMFQTANAHQPEPMFRRFLDEVQPDMPLMVMEFYAGWFNHWGDERRYGRSSEEVKQVLEDTYGRWNGSVNIYMFHGGTSFGFFSGANGKGEAPYIHQDTTSYEFDSPLTEAGDYTEKYYIIRNVTDKYEIPKLRRPAEPEESRKVSFPTLQPQRYLTYNDLISQVPSTSKVIVEHADAMEKLPINNDNGQSYGYIIYRKQLPLSPDQDAIFKGTRPRDIAFLIVDEEPVSVTNSTDEYWINSVKEVPLTVTTAGNHTVDLLVESLSRINHGTAEEFVQQKGLPKVYDSKIEINGEEVTNLEVISLEFKNAWVKNLTQFRDIGDTSLPLKAPVLIEYTFTIPDGGVGDTWLDMSGWNKGIVFVNGFNIGRFWKIGPQKNLYVPAPFLRTGQNTIRVFEIVQPSNELVFSDEPNLGPPPIY